MSEENMWFKIFVLLVGLLTVVLCQDYFDDDNPSSSCTLRNGTPGQCTPLNDCPSAQQDLRRNIRPVNCWFNQQNPVICCRVSDNLASESKSEKKCMEMYTKRPKRTALEKSTINKKPVVIAVHGGINSLSKEFKHMAALGFGEKDDITWACGGSLISEKFVLTAAHCLNTKNLGEVKFVRLGDLNLKQDNDDADPQDFEVARKIRHPQYKPPSQYHDIALIELDKPARITPYVKPACLQAVPKVSDSVWIATGWGNLEFGGSTADHLQKVNLREFSTEECSKFYGPNRRLTNGILGDSQMCAGDVNKDTCQGDSGGPLQIKNSDYTDGYRIIGITSFGKACGISSAPGVYTRVSNYIGWIESVVWPN